MSSFLTRRRAVAVLVCVPVALIAPARASSKVPKSAVLYQDHPHAGKQCSECRQFLGSAAETGQCVVVEGAVSSAGWCLAFADRT